MQMLGALLKDGDLSRYQQYLAGRIHQPLFFMHIPKTAGSSLTHEIADSTKSYRNIFVESASDRGDYRKQFIEILSSAKSSLAQHTAFSGHATILHLLHTGWDLDDLRLVTILRNPVDRLVSEYLYRISPAHFFAEAEARAHPTLEAFLDANPDISNTQWQYLRPRPQASLEETIDFVLEKFSFVGCLDLYPLSARMITHLLGNPRFPTRVERKTDRAGFSLSDDLRDRILHENSLDYAIYRFFRERLIAHRADFYSICA